MSIRKWNVKRDGVNFDKFVLESSKSDKEFHHIINLDKSQILLDRLKTREWFKKYIKKVTVSIPIGEGAIKEFWEGSGREDD